MGRSPSDKDESRQSHHVNDMDRLFWGVESDPHLRNTMTGVIVMSGPPDRKLVMDRLERASRLVPGWRHRLETPPLYLANPRWTPDPNFDLAYHVRWIGAPQEGTLASVLEWARAATVSGLDKQRPLWTVTFVDGLEGGRTAAVLKLHHVLVDGYGGIGLLPVILDIAPEAPDLGPMPPLPEPEHLGTPGLVVDAVLTTRERLVGFTRSSVSAAVRKAPSALPHPRSTAAAVQRNVSALRRVLRGADKPMSPIMTGRQGWYRWVPLEVDLERLKEAAHRSEATVNDAFMTGIGYGFALYHQHKGEPVERLRTAMAVTYRTGLEDQARGNQVGGGHIEMPVGTENLQEIMQSAQTLAGELRDSALQPLAKMASTVTSAFGPFLADYIGTIMKRCDLLLSNIPGIDVPLWLGGAPVEAMYGFGPAMGTAANATLVSYNGKAFIGLNVDTSAVDDLDLLVHCVREGFDAVLDLAEVS